MAPAATLRARKIISKGASRKRIWCRDDDGLLRPPRKIYRSPRAIAKHGVEARSRGTRVRYYSLWRPIFQVFWQLVVWTLQVGSGGGLSPDKVDSLGEAFVPDRRVTIVRDASLSGSTREDLSMQLRRFSFVRCRSLLCLAAALRFPSKVEE